VLLLLATIWAGLAKSFFQLLTAVCLQGMVAGINVSAVGLMKNLKVHLLICHRCFS
jgi:hypothetical protein